MSAEVELPHLARAWTHEGRLLPLSLTPFLAWIPSSLGYQHTEGSPLGRTLAGGFKPVASTVARHHKRIARLGHARKFPPPDVSFLSVEDEVTFEYGNTSTQARTQSEDASGIGHQPEEYVEPWDNVRSNYPVTLPLRRPYSGDPEVLNRLEFGEGNSSSMPLNENKINAAQKLGFMETDDEPKMIFLQLPSHVLLPKPPNEEKGTGNKAANLSSKAWKFKDIPTGFMGKLLVYRNGKVKMKWEDVLFDVNPGIDCTFAEEIVTVNAKEKHYCVIGELTKHAVVTPDIDLLLGGLNDSDA